MSCEQMMHLESCFLTLTYSDSHLPKYGQLVKKDLQDFFKALRYRIGPFRYVACGEYGERFRRPHFHVALYGRDFREERLLYSKARGGEQLFTSPTVDKAWGKGLAPLGTLTFESSAYIARYITKRLTPSDRLSLLPLHIEDDGEIIFPNPEFLVCSKGRKAGDGIGGSWWRQFADSDVLPHGRIAVRGGRELPVPRYFKKQLDNPHWKNLGNPVNAKKAQLMMQSGEAFADHFSVVEDSQGRRAARTRYANARTGVFMRDME